MRVARELGKVTEDFLFFVFLILVKLSYKLSEKPASTFIQVDGEMHWLPVYFDNPVFVHFNELAMS